MNDAEFIANVLYFADEKSDPTRLSDFDAPRAERLLPHVMRAFRDLKHAERVYQLVVTDAKKEHDVD